MGIDDLLNVTVSVENSEENSYNSHVLLTYPAGLSYRKVTVLQVNHQFTQVYLCILNVFIYLFIYLNSTREELSATPLTVRMELSEERQIARLTNLYLGATPRFDRTLTCCCDERRDEHEHLFFDYRFFLLFPTGLNPTINLIKGFLSPQTQQGNFRAAKAQPCMTSRYFTILEKNILSFSQNEEHSRLSNLYSIKWIDVKYSIFVTLERFVILSPKFLTLTKEC